MPLITFIDTLVKSVNIQCFTFIQFDKIKTKHYRISLNALDHVHVTMKSTQFQLKLEHNGKQFSNGSGIIRNL